MDALLLLTGVSLLVTCVCATLVLALARQVRVLKHAQDAVEDPRDDLAAGWQGELALTRRHLAATGDALQTTQQSMKQYRQGYEQARATLAYYEVRDTLRQAYSDFVQLPVRWSTREERASGVTVTLLYAEVTTAKEDPGAYLVAYDRMLAFSESEVWQRAQADPARARYPFVLDIA